MGMGMEDDGHGYGDGAWAADGMAMGEGTWRRCPAMEKVDEFPLDMSVEIYGIIYIYNPPDPEKFGVEQVTEDTVIDGATETLGGRQSVRPAPAPGSGRRAPDTPARRTCGRRRHRRGHTLPRTATALRPVAAAMHRLRTQCLNPVSLPQLQTPLRLNSLQGHPMDADKIKEFFLFHFEKMILVGVIGASGFLIYKGLAMPNFLKNSSLTRLAEATQVKSDIDENHNEAIIPDRDPTFDILEPTKKLYTAVDPTDYNLPTHLGRKERAIDRASPRSRLLAPARLSPRRVVAVDRDSRQHDGRGGLPLASLEDAEPLEKVEAKPKREPEKIRRGRGGMDEWMMEMEWTWRWRWKWMMGWTWRHGDGGGSMGGGDPRGDSIANTILACDPRQPKTKRNPDPSVGWFIAGTAVVPHKELYEAYELALKDADQYDPRRDTPIYFNLDVQRADVTDKPVDQLAEEDWVKIWDRSSYTKLAALRWSGFAPEIVPADYRDEALTMWIPPVLLDDYSRFATHPLIPMIPQKELKKLLNRG